MIRTGETKVKEELADQNDSMRHVNNTKTKSDDVEFKKFIPDAKGTKGEESEALFDGLMECIGNNGRFQNRFNLVFNFVLVTLVTMPYLNIVFAMTVPSHWCHVPGRSLTNFSEEEWKTRTIPEDVASAKGSGTYSSCKMFSQNASQGQVIDCQYGWEYDRQWYSETAPSMENWVCDKELYVTNVFVAGRVGEIIGTFVFGQLGDQIGRRPVFYISLTTLIVGRIGSAFTSHTYHAFLATIVLGSLATTSVFQSPLVICMEVSGENKRAHIAFMQCLGWVIGMCALPMLAWGLRDWSLLMVVTTLPCVIYYFTFKLLPESPRWLVSRGRVDESLNVLKYIASVNKTQVPDSAENVLRKIAEKKEKIYGIPSLFFHWRLAKNTIIIVICWIACGLSYYSLVLNVSNMAGNPFMNFFWQSLVELPGYILGRSLSNCVGRRWTQSGSYAAASVFCLVVVAIHNIEIPWLVTTFVALIKLCVTTTFYMVWLQAIEIYPTCLRQTGTSIGGLMANVFGILGPYVVFLGTSIDARLPYVVLLGTSILGMITSSFLPETLNQKLPETMEEAHNFGKDQKFWAITGRKSTK